MDAIPKIKNTCGDIKIKTYIDNLTDRLPTDTVYNKLVKLCVQNNYTIKDVSKRAEVKYHTLNGYKNRVSDYCPVTLHKVAAIFGLDVRYFIDFDMSKLGDRIKYFRVINGYGVSEFADLLGVHRDTIKTWESNQFMPSESNTKKLILFLGDGFLHI